MQPRGNKCDEDHGSLLLFPEVEAVKAVVVILERGVDSDREDRCQEHEDDQIDDDQEFDDEGQFGDKHPEEQDAVFHREVAKHLGDRPLPAEKSPSCPSASGRYQELHRRRRGRPGRGKDLREGHVDDEHQRHRDDQGGGRAQEMEFNVPFNPDLLLDGCDK